MVPGAYNTYVRLKIGGVVFDYDNTENILSIDVVRQVDDTCMQFVIEVYDESSYNLEAVILSSEDSKNIDIEYGYCEDSERRSPVWKGIVTKVTPHFDVQGETLTIEGTAFTEWNSLINAECKTYYGTPDHVFLEVAREENWNIKWSIPSVMPDPTAYDPDETQWCAIRKNNESAHQFIERAVAPYATTQDGKSGFRLTLIPMGETIDAYFMPASDMQNAFVNQSYELTIGEPSEEVISFAPVYNYLTTLMGSEGVNISTIDSFTGEDITTDAYVEGKAMAPGRVSVVANRASLSAIGNMAKDIMVSARDQVYPADLVIKGDPNITPGHYISINVLTKDGNQHPTSGTYFIQCVEDMIDGGAFTSKLSLQKMNGDVIASSTTSTARMVYTGGRVTNLYSTASTTTVSPGKVSNYTKGKSLGVFHTTSYCPCQKCCDQWSYEVTGTPNKTGLTGDVPCEGRTIAVDPNKIPAGTWVMWDDEVLGTVVRRAEDKGGGIKQNRIDVFFGSFKPEDHQRALKEYKQQDVEVFIAEPVYTQDKVDVAIPPNVPKTAILEAIQPYLGLPYVWGGKYVSKSGGLDCSGFSGTIMNQLGGNPQIDLSYWGSNKQSEHGQVVPVTGSDGLGSAMPGDLLFKGTGPGHTQHVTIYLGNGMMAHAPHTGDVIKIAKVYFKPCCIRRYL